MQNIKPKKIHIGKREFDIHEYDPAKDLDPARHIVYLSTGGSAPVSAGLLEAAHFPFPDISDSITPPWGEDILVDTFHTHYGRGYRAKYGRFAVDEGRLNVIDSTGWHFTPASYLDFSVFMGDTGTTQIPAEPALRHALISFTVSFVPGHEIPRVTFKVAGFEIKVLFSNEMKTTHFYIDKPDDSNNLQLGVHVRNTEEGTIYLQKVELFRKFSASPGTNEA